MSRKIQIIVEGLVFAIFGGALFYPIIDTYQISSYTHFTIELFIGFQIYKLIPKKR